MKNIGIFRLTPQSPDGDYAQSHQSKGKDYHNRFSKWHGRAMMQALESTFIINTIENKKIFQYLDFACGTGRILDITASYSDSTFALDVSQSMLEVAKSRHDKCNFLCKDFREGIEEIENIKFDLITAFRFFPNAERNLRISALKYLSQRLSDDGILILNNHQNFWSIPYIFYRFLGLKSGQRGMTDSDIKQLAQQASLKIAHRVSLGVVPQTERISAIGWPVTRIIERINQRLLSRFHLLGYNVIYVLTHDQK